MKTNKYKIFAAPKTLKRNTYKPILEVQIRKAQ